MQPVVTILPLSRILSPPGLIKILGRPVYSSSTISIRVASPMMLVGSYFALLSGIGITPGKHQPLSTLAQR
jgi:hypothetical protein